jgi:nitrate reductase gamma subunit
MNKSFKLTEKGQKQLETFKEQQVNALLVNIIKRKSYPGIDEVEITSNDILEESKNWVYIVNNRNKRRTLILKSFAYMYICLGLVLSFLSLFYDDIKYIFERNPEQVAFILAGLLLSLLGLFLLFYTRITDIRLKLEQTPEKE